MIVSLHRSSLGVEAGFTASITHHFSKLFGENPTQDCRSKKADFDVHSIPLSHIKMLFFLLLLFDTFLVLIQAKRFFYKSSKTFLTNQIEFWKDRHMPETKMYYQFEKNRGTYYYY